jgi:hypothetical protein
MNDETNERFLNIWSLVKDCYRVLLFLYHSQDCVPVGSGNFA